MTDDDGVQRAWLLDVLAGVVPAGALEREHLEFARAWAGSGAEVYRRGVIDVPPTHLVVYFVPLDTGGNADGGQITSYDDTEFTAMRWWPLHALRQQLAARVAEGFEPHLGRFLGKLTSLQITRR
jgi:hypothetical protein